MKVNCWNEYDKLKTVILGSVYDIDRVPDIYQGKDQESFVKINEQSYYELLEFQKILEQHGVTVLRPKQPKSYNDSIDWHKQSPLINMRDFHLAYGNLFFLTYGSYKNRRFQHAWLEDIVNNFIDNDNLVISANEFNYYNNDFLKKENLVNHFTQTYRVNYAGKNLFHTAGLLKHNKKALASKVAGTTTGTKWMKNWLATLGIEYIEYDWIGHIDGGHSILNNDLLLTGNYPTKLSENFKNTIKVPTSSDFWDWRNDKELAKKIRNPTGWLYECQGYFQQFCAEANALSINPETVCLSFYDKDFYSILNDKGITVIYIPWINRHFWGGGLHCITLDIERISV